MTGEVSVRFWQPAPEAGTELLGAYLETSEAPAHLHEEWQFGVLEAPSKLSLGAFQRSSAQPGEVTIVHPYEVHSERGIIGATPKWRLLYVAPAMVNRLYGREAPRFRRPVVADPAAAGELYQLLRHSGDGTITGSELLSRVAHWLRQFLLRHAESTAPQGPLQPVERARVYLQNHPTRSLSLLEIGAVAGVSLSHLVRSFSRTVGLPPQSYHLQVRLARARRLLAEGKPATWVAYECGFADQSHLSRRFKECHGVTPGVFQDQYLPRPGSLAPVDSTAA